MATGRGKHSRKISRKCFNGNILIDVGSSKERARETVASDPKMK
jgi:hypothetical protein